MSGSENNNLRQANFSDQGEQLNSIDDSSHHRQLLDFLSPEFNRVDDLDDTVGNYRSFEPLNGVITADMRYHEKRERKKRRDTGVETQSAEPAAEAGDAGKENIPELLPLTIVSGGRILLIDGDSDRALRCAQLLNRKKMDCTLCRPGADKNGVSVSRIDSFPMIETCRVSVTGSFGGFCATVTAGGGGQENLSILAGNRSGSFDLVLDMQQRVSYAGGRQLPAGYFAPAGDTAALEAALRELAELRGRFSKPQFTTLLTDRCLHGRSRHHACRRCVEICSFGACSQDKHRIVVDQYRCQGCGACALVCPTGAIELHNPSPEEMRALLIERVRKEAEPGKGMHVVLYDGTFDPDDIKASSGLAAIHAVLFEVEDIGRVGLELMLALLACGATGVTVCCDRNMANVCQALLSQVELGRNILQGLALPPRLLSLVNPGAPNEEPLGASSSPVDLPADFDTARDRRTMIRHAAGHLASFSPAPGDAVALPEGSPFGTIAIDDSCSLCMACVGSCPAEALCAGGDRPSLSLIEASCHQCGLCAEICPEQAIRLVPRLFLDAGRAGEKTLLREMQPVTCVACGSPFAAGAMIRRIEEKLAGHWMYGTDRQKRRLQMCRTCRTRDALLEGGFHR